MNSRILITGFTPFPGHPVNSSQKLVEGLAAQFADAANMHFRVLPTEYQRSLRVLRGAIDRHNPDIVLCFGVAANRDHISLERIGKNACSTKLPDAGGFVPAQPCLVAGGAAEYETNLPLDRLRHDLNTHGLPVKISDDAGDYVCNSILYHLLVHIHTGGEQRLNRMKAGFIHIPDPARKHGISAQDLHEAGQLIIAGFNP